MPTIGNVQRKAEPNGVTIISQASVLTPFHQVLEKLPPAYFAMVMSTGVLALACRLEKFQVLPELLLAINLITYLILWALTILRARYYPKQFIRDFCSHQNGPGFFTMVAATSVLGTQVSVQLHMVAVAQAMWWFAFVLWLLLTYSIFTALTVHKNKPAFEDGINGSWLTAVVATQSLVVFACSMMPDQISSEAAIFGLLSLWLVGGMLYIWTISLIFYRYTFFRFSPQDLSPPYWINMGAMAISTLAGVLLVSVVNRSPLLVSLLPFLKGFTLLFWATATWWIPMLVVLGVWRHVYHKVPLTYDPLYWGFVFPLAMYTTATYKLAEIFNLSFLFLIPRLFIGLALTAWLLTFLGLALAVITGLMRNRKKAGIAISSVVVEKYIN